MTAKRPPRGSHLPGTYWYYNNWDFNTLGTIFERVTRTKIFEEFKRRIADPIGMEDYRVEDGFYVTGKKSIHSAYHFRVTSRDMARFGLLYLRQGVWNGRQVIPREWIAESTTSYSDAGSGGGYGYMWWVATNGKLLPSMSMPERSFSARDNGGQYILIVPPLDLVIVHQVNTENRGKRVTQRQFGKLVRLILEARIAP
jgi:CubicO group peptidase (beta-lactamase class C family)